MRVQITQSEVNMLESVIDRVGMAEFAEAVVAIAHGKSEHLVTNWQEPSMAKVWTRIARKFDKLIPALELNDDVLGFGK